MRDDLLDLLAAEWRGERGHGAYRSQMPQAPIRVHELESCDSTQDELRALAAAGAPAFTAVRADVQQRGAGAARTALGGARGHGAAGLDPAATRSARSTSCPCSASRAASPPSSARAPSARLPASAGPTTSSASERKLARRARRARSRGQRAARHRHEPLRRGPPDLPAGDRLAPTSLLLETGAAPARAASPRRAARRGAARSPRLFDAEGPAAIAARARALDALDGRSGAAPSRGRRGRRGHRRRASRDDGSLLVRSGDERAALRERRGRAADAEPGST